MALPSRLSRTLPRWRSCLLLPLAKHGRIAKISPKKCNKALI